MLFDSSVRKELARSFGLAFVVILTIVVTMLLVRSLGLAAKGSVYLTRPTLFTHIATREATQAMGDDLFGMVASGQVKIHIDRRYALAEVADAHRDLEARKIVGSAIFTL